MGLYRDTEIEELDVNSWEKSAYEEFKLKMEDKERPFPCIPATIGHSLHHFRYGFVGDPREASTIDKTAEFLTNYTKISRELGNYTSLIIFFKTSDELAKSYSVAKFEEVFWDLLNGISSLDQMEWPSHIPIDPENPLWEYCFHNEQYFMYCGTPAHEKRKSRKATNFMLAITPRWVLEEFHSVPSRVSSMKPKIRKRLENYDSISIHPDLKSYGQEDNFEWKQYYLHDDHSSLSKCPFHKAIRSLKEDDNK